MKEEVMKQMQGGPGEAARQELGLGTNSPLPSRWTVRTIGATVEWMKGMSVSGVWQALQGMGIKLRQARTRLFSPDPAYASKLEQVKAVLRQAALHPDDTEAVFLDEFGFNRWPTPVRVWGVTPAQADRDGNNTQWRTIGSLNALTGRVDFLDNYIVGRKQVIAFYAKLDQAYPRPKSIYIIHDNWSIHTHPDVLAALAQYPRLHTVSLPTYSPWLNPIEKLWRWLRQDVLHMHRFVHDWKSLRQRVRHFLNQFASGSSALLHYVGLRGDGLFARLIAHP
jgi:transposase